MLRQQIKLLRPKLVAEYLDGLSEDSVAQKYRVSRQAVRTALKNVNVRPRKVGPYRQHRLNECWFHNIKTEEQAYWLGFISADGGISGRYLRIELQVQDVGHLKKFLQCVQPTGKIYYSKRLGRNLTAYISISSQQMINDLKAFGVVPNKSLILKPPKSLPVKLVPHYFRGLVDGDGCLYFNNGVPTISLVGSKWILQAFCKWVQTFSSTKVKLCRTKHIYLYSIGGVNMAPPVIFKLYAHANIYLDRKMKIAKQMLKEYHKRIKRSGCK